MGSELVNGSTGEVLDGELITGEPSAIMVHDKGALDVQVATAKAYPRSVQEFRVDLEAWACLDKSIADTCTYAKPQGNGTIQGPSIRFAELALAAYKNTVSETAVVDDGGERGKRVVVVGTCRDLERNTASRAEVTRAICGRNGKRYPQHLIETTIAAASAIARRNAIFQIIPRALWTSVWERSKLVMIGEGKSHGDRVKEYREILKTYSVDPKDVETWVGTRWEDMTSDHLVTIHLRLDAINAHQVKPSEAFPSPDDDDTDATLARDERPSAKSASDALGKASGRKKKGNPEPEIDEATGEVIPDDLPTGGQLGFE